MEKEEAAFAVASAKTNMFAADSSSTKRFPALILSALPFRENSDGLGSFRVRAIPSSALSPSFLTLSIIQDTFAEIAELPLTPFLRSMYASS